VLLDNLLLIKLIGIRSHLCNRWKIQVYTKLRISASRKKYHRIVVQMALRALEYLKYGSSATPDNI